MTSGRLLLPAALALRVLCGEAGRDDVDGREAVRCEITRGAAPRWVRLVRGREAGADRLAKSEGPVERVGSGLVRGLTGPPVRARVAGVADAITPEPSGASLGVAVTRRVVTVTDGVLGVVTVVGVVIGVLGVVTFTLGVVTVVVGTFSTLGVVTVTLGRASAGKLGIVTVTDGSSGLGDVAALATPERPVLRPAAAPRHRASRIAATRSAQGRRDARPGGRELVVALSGTAPTLVETDGGPIRGGGELDVVHHVGYGGKTAAALRELVGGAGW